VAPAEAREASWQKAKARADAAAAKAAADEAQRAKLADLKVRAIVSLFLCILFSQW
jgi:hypothetical protein